ncbi:hypothetical protein EV424DRAFT_1318507 [Suillus variegatus]|nr:hypothetical protein EV424DRAFT_1318507 [Suillus variegatus]
MSSHLCVVFIIDLTCSTCRGHCIIVNKPTTLRRHAEARFVGKYRKWAKANSFTSKLPGDVAAEKKKVTQAQQTIDVHVTECKISERVIPYSDQLFRKAAIEWLITTDQPIQALEHPRFKEMMDVASRATQGVKILGRKATRAEIMRMFKTHLTRLKKKLNVSTILDAILY